MGHAVSCAVKYSESAAGDVGDNRVRPIISVAIASAEERSWAHRCISYDVSRCDITIIVEELPHSVIR